MRKVGPPSELGRLAAPLLGGLDWLWQRMHWWIAAMAILYAMSGITVVKPDEVALVLRWGRLVGSTPALQQHGPGLLLALPRPIDQVVRVRIKHVFETRITTLTDVGWSATNTLDPVIQGYALTGDQNIVHVEMVARYRVRDPAQWVFYGPKSENVIRVEVTAAMVRSLGEMGIDPVLSEGRKALIAAASRRAQAGLDAAHAGLELTSLEIVRLSPPVVLVSDFDAVQSAYIGAETKKKDAQAYAESTVLKTQAEVNAAVQSARAEAKANLARAEGDADAFRALDREYRANPAVVREQLYRDAVDRAIGSAEVRWVPPPAGARYHPGFRIEIPLAKAGGAQHAPEKAVGAGGGSQVKSGPGPSPNPGGGGK